MRISFVLVCLMAIGSKAVNLESTPQSLSQTGASVDAEAGMDFGALAGKMAGGAIGALTGAPPGGANPDAPARHCCPKCPEKPTER